MSPTIVNVLEAVQITVQAEYCALVFGADAVAPVDVIVTPAPCANVSWPAPICWTWIWSLAVKTEGGTVMVAAALTVTNSLRSPIARV
jgi:hypothetical protein